jgi:hypothetical protein
VHGLNERIRIQSVYEGRSLLYQLVKLYADQRHPTRHRRSVLALNKNSPSMHHGKEK